MSRIFLSHSSANNAEAVALYAWLERQGWKDEIFLDLDSERGIKAGERWERALHAAADRCEAVLFLVSKAWIASPWCGRELNLAHRLNKRLFGVLIEDLAVADIPQALSGEWQLVRLASGRDHVLLQAVVPITHDEVHVTFSAEGLQRLKRGLEQAGLDPKHFAWPPANDPGRAPYRGLRPLESDDAGIYFGREGAVLNTIDNLRGLRELSPPRFLAILGPSGSGKSSFLRAGLLPRLARDDRNFLPLPIVRPGRAVLSGETGLLVALEGAGRDAGVAVTRASLRAEVEGGAESLGRRLQTLVDKATLGALDGDAEMHPPTVVLAIDQGEELFVAEGQNEARSFLTLLKSLLLVDAPAMIVLVTIRSDSYELLQLAPELTDVRQQTFSLLPMPTGSYGDVIRGPPRRLEQTTRPLRIEDALVDKLLVDIEDGGGKDALPLLAFTLERLYVEHGGDGDLRLDEYEALGGIRGSIEAAVERAFQAADADPSVTNERTAGLALLRRGLIPWLAGIDPDTGTARRRVAQLSEIPADAQRMIRHLIDQRLLITDVAKSSGAATIEVAHEALLRQWGLLQTWLAEDAGMLAVLEAVKRASREWVANGRSVAWLSHATSRLETAERLKSRPDLAANLDQSSWDYLAACRRNESTQRGHRLRLQGLVVALLVGLATLLPSTVSYLDQRIRLWPVFWNVAPTPLAPTAEAALKAGDPFSECANCPEMVVVPAGEFVMGQAGSDTDEIPTHKVTIAKSFAISRFEVTFDDWDACVAHGGCTTQPSDAGWGRGARPVIFVNWNDAQQYAAWLSHLSGKSYRLLSEAEWEYAARAGTTTAFPWGDAVGEGHADCRGCGGPWDGKLETAPVGSFAFNAFKLGDMAGNVWEWLQDCYQDHYTGAPTDGSAVTSESCNHRVVRGGSWGDDPDSLRSAFRNWDSSIVRGYDLGFRLARNLGP